MEAELQTYRDQLAYVNLSLESDPSNDDLLKLKAELNELIDLTQQAMGHIGAAKGVDIGKEKAKTKGKEKEKEITNWQDQGPYKAGMDCMAKYKDGKWQVIVSTGWQNNCFANYLVLGIPPESMPLLAPKNLHCMLSHSKAIRLPPTSPFHL